MAHPLERFLTERVQHGIGLMSGTSMDGIDAALVRFTAGDDPAPLHVPGARVELLQLATYPYAEPLAEGLRRAAGGGALTAEAWSELDAAVSRAFADAALRLLEEAGRGPEAIDFLACHGQTVVHCGAAGTGRDPGRAGPIRAHTLQLGRPTVLAARTGIVAVGDFRSGDVALGGQGAPLVPLADFLLHAHPSRDRILLNLGGIANLTFLPAGCGPDGVVAFDTGPGNMVCDRLMQVLTEGRERYDSSGRTASAGRASEELVTELLRHPFFARRPPKSAGRREFGEGFAEGLLERGTALGLGRHDLLATAAELTVRSVDRAIVTFLGGRAEGVEIYVCGGGARNERLLSGLRGLGYAVETTLALGLDPDAKEAVDFAVLGRERLYGRPGNLVRVTGASRPVPLGSVALPASPRATVPRAR